jgi:hypothetical protein
MTCAEMADRFVDRLYGELAEGERPAFEAHLGSCEGCRTQLASFEQTRRSARLALQGPLSLPAPDRIRRAALAAAEVHVRNRAPASTRAAFAVPTTASGFWAWLRRPWFLPAFATVSLLAIFFITRPMLMDGPRRTLQSYLSEPEPEAEAESVAVEAQGAAPASPPPPAEPAAPSPSVAPPVQPAPIVVTGGSRDRDAASALRRARLAAELEELRKQKVADLRSERVIRTGPAPVRRLSAPAKKAETKAKTSLDDEMLAPVASAAGGKEAAAPPVMVPARARAEEQPAANYLIEGARPAVGLRADLAQGEAAMKRSKADEDRPRTRFVPPPPMAPRLARPFASGAGAPAASAPAAPPPAPAPAEPAAAPRRAERAAASADESDAPSAPAGRGASTAPLNLDALIEKAERLYTAQQWPAAADTYRELLRRFPTHARAPLWRQRLEAATRATAR